MEGPSGRKSLVMAWITCCGIVMVVAMIIKAARFSKGWLAFISRDLREKDR
jgi:hypothetical protein